MTDVYGHEYYSANNYASYLERYERYKMLVNELCEDLFSKIGLENKFRHGSVLDFGCAVGFVVKALQERGYEAAYGYDVSEWAVQHGTSVLNVENLSNDARICQWLHWDVVFALDVLEHMTIEQIAEFLKCLNSDYIVARIPVVLEDGGKFVLEVSERDKTHVTRLTKNSWKKLFALHDYEVIFSINLNQIYDTKGVMCVMLKHKETIV